MRALNRTQNLLMKDRGQQSRPVSRASTLWSAQELSSTSSKRRPLSARVKSDAEVGCVFIVQINNTDSVQYIL